MNLGFVRTIFDFQVHEDRRLWDDAILPLEDRLFTVDTGYSWGSLQRETVHVVDAMHRYLQRIHGVKHVTEAISIDDPSQVQIRAKWDDLEALWRSYLETLDGREFYRRVDTIYRGERVTVPVWNLIFQIFNHNTLHRAEMLHMIATLRRAVDFDMSFAQFCLLQTE